MIEFSLCTVNVVLPVFHFNSLDLPQNEIQPFIETLGIIKPQSV